jgi:hypothetical protein
MRVVPVFPGCHACPHQLGHCLTACAASRIRTASFTKSRQASWNRTSMLCRAFAHVLAGYVIRHWLLQSFAPLPVYSRLSSHAAEAARSATGRDKRPLHFPCMLKDRFRTVASKKPNYAITQQSCVVVSSQRCVQTTFPTSSWLRASAANSRRGRNACRQCRRVRVAGSSRA